MPHRCPTHGDFLPLPLDHQLVVALDRRRRLQGRLRDYERRMLEQRRAAAAYDMQVSIIDFLILSSLHGDSKYDIQRILLFSTPPSAREQPELNVRFVLKFRAVLPLSSLCRRHIGMPR